MGSRAGGVDSGDVGAITDGRLLILMRGELEGEDARFMRFGVMALGRALMAMLTRVDGADPGMGGGTSAGGGGGGASLGGGGGDDGKAEGGGGVASSESGGGGSGGAGCMGGGGALVPPNTPEDVDMRILTP